MRIGQGFDVHAFGEGRPLILGGTTIPYHLGLQGHSDADVVIHALCDALLGAAGLGDIGQHFPDNDEQFKNIDSRLLLEEVVQKLAEKQFTLVNIDMTILAQEPKLQPYMPEMKACIAHVCQLDLDQVNLKATTTEHLGFLGRKEGIAAFAVVLITRNHGANA